MKTIHNLLRFSALIIFIVFYIPQSVSAQTAPIQIGGWVQVNTGNQNLNLRSQPGTRSLVVARLPDGTVMQVVGGPQSADGYQWWQLQGAVGTGWAAAQYLLPIEAPAGALPNNASPYNQPSAAQEPLTVSTAVDWRANLNCSPSGEIYAGVEYCTGIEKDLNGKQIPGAEVYVLVIDLSVQGVEFQYILPEGYSDLKTSADDQSKALHECRDPNVPHWGGPEGGCYINSGQEYYPTIDMLTAQARAQAVIQGEGRSTPLAAMLNADYAAQDKRHGPEGLLVVRGERLDGAEHCDDDFNAALRPWLGLGNSLDPSLGRLKVEINRLERDSSPLPDWINTAIGGGPLLIDKGDIVPGSERCKSTKTLTNLETVANCNYASEVSQEKNKNSAASEGYGSGSCGSSAHPAAGISRDGRWLFLALNSRFDNPGALARFMDEQLGVERALKFDGGGSAKMLFKGPNDIFKMPKPDNPERRLSNYLAIYSPSGTGIQLPLAADPLKRVYYQVLNAGETADVVIEFTNTGNLTWHPDDGVELRLEPWSILSPVIEALPLSAPIAPGETASWTWNMNTSGVLVHRFQMYQKKEPFGPEAAVILVVLPKGWEDKRQEIEQGIQDLIDGWEKQKDAALDQLIQQIVDYAEKKLNDYVKKIFSGCTSPALLLGAVALVFAWGRRRKVRKPEV